MPVSPILAALVLSCPVGDVRPPAPAGEKLPTVEQLIPLVPRVSSRSEHVRSFAFETTFFSDGTNGMRTRGWYAGPGRFALLVLDAADNTPLLYASGGKGVVYDALAGRCLPFDYGSIGYN